MGGTFYPNGAIPLNRMRHLGGNHYLPAGTAARWLWMVREGEKKYSITLRITGDVDGLGGWNAYRPLAAQRRYKAHYGPGAAAPGHSSHGGVYGGQVCMAIDVTNWGELGWGRFSALARLAGFRVNFVSPQELWHIGDFNDPWTVPAGFTTDGDEMVSKADKEEIAELAAKKVWQYGLNGQSAGQRLRTQASNSAVAVWNFIIGRAGSPDVSHGRAADILARADARAGKAAVRSSAQLTEDDLRAAIEGIIIEAGDSLTEKQITDALDAAFRNAINDVTVTLGTK